MANYPILRTLPRLVSPEYALLNAYAPTLGWPESPIGGLPRQVRPVPLPSIVQVAAGSQNGGTATATFDRPMTVGNTLLTFSGRGAASQNIFGGSGAAVMYDLYSIGTGTSPSVRAQAGHIVTAGIQTATCTGGSSGFRALFAVEVAGVFGRGVVTPNRGAVFTALPIVPPGRRRLFFDFVYCQNGGASSPSFTPAGPQWQHRGNSNFYSLAYGYTDPIFGTSIVWTANGCSVPFRIVVAIA